MDSKDRQIEELKTLVAALTKRVAELELALAKATKDSIVRCSPIATGFWKWFVKRNFFSFLLESIKAKQIHQPAPTLLSA